MAEFLLMPQQRFRLFICWLAAILFFITSEYAKAQVIPSWEWVQAVGGGIGNQSTCYGVAADANGNSYITGSFVGTGRFGAFTLTSAPQTQQLYVAKLGPTGTYQWARTVTNYGRGEGQALAVDAAGNIYVTGNFDGPLTFGATTLTPMGSNDVFVAKLSPGGTWLWAKSGGGYSLDVGRAIIVSPSGTVYVAGQIRDFANFGTTPQLQATLGFADIFVAALDAATGTWQWSRCAMGNPATTIANNYGWSLGLNAVGEVYLGGIFAGQATFGNITLTGAGSDIFVAKLTAAGTWLWARQAGGASTDACRALAVDGPGNVYLTGDYSGPATFGNSTVTGAGKIYVAKLDGSGAWQWVRASAGSASGFGRGIALDASGQRIYVGGNFSSALTLGTITLTSVGTFDQYVAALDASGTWLWAQQAIGVNRVVTNGLTADANGAVYTCGYVLGNATFGPFAVVHPNPPAEQPYVARLAAGLPTATVPSSLNSLTIWPCPTAPAEAVHVRWCTNKRPVAVVLLDVLGREVTRIPLSTSNSTSEASFSAPSLIGWYQCQVVFSDSPAISMPLVVQP
jgi:hypothetical protein